MTNSVNRRAFLGGTAVAALGAGAAFAGDQNSGLTVRGGFASPKEATQGPAPEPRLAVEIPDLKGDYSFEVVRTEAEWREMLDPEGYNILRHANTELPETGELWKTYDPGTYHCRGCDLRIYDSTWKVDVGIGWNFFRHSVPDSTHTGIDGPVVEYGQDPNGPDNMIEIHCRRCGSHMGHVVRVNRDPLHCINGQSLVFKPLTA